MEIVWNYKRWCWKCDGKADWYGITRGGGRSEMERQSSIDERLLREVVLEV
jgi:hypothetical protein